MSSKNKRSIAREKSKKLFIFSYLAPAFILYIIFFIIPSIDALRISLTNWTGFGTTPNYIGLKNYSFLIKDEIFWTALGNSFIFMFSGGAFVFFFAILYAFLLTNYVRNRNFFLNIFYFPNLISFSALTILFVFVFDGNFGLINSVLKALSLDQFAIAWLGSRITGMAAITTTGVWFYMGFYLIIINAGISKIPGSFFEAAICEGAGRIRIFFKITLPLIWDVITIAISLWIINSLKLFEIVWGMTKGGPSSQTHVVGTYIYTNAFGTAQLQSFRLGYASTLAVALVFIVLLLMGVFRKISAREIYEY